MDLKTDDSHMMRLRVHKNVPIRLADAEGTGTQNKFKSFWCAQRTELILISINLYQSPSCRTQYFTRVPYRTAPSSASDSNFRTKLRMVA